MTLLLGAFGFVLSYLFVLLDFFEQKQQEIFIFAAKFKAQHGDTKGAKLTLDYVNSELSPPYCFDAVVQYADMEHQMVLLHNVSLSFAYSESFD